MPHNCHAVKWVTEDVRLKPGNQSLETAWSTVVAVSGDLH